MEVPNASVASEMVIDDDCDRSSFTHIASQFSTYLDIEYSIMGKSEVDRYLVDFCEGERDEKFDILGLWKANSSKYHVLSQLARDVLAMPGSTVASESAFSWEDAYLILFAVHSLLRWLRYLFVHKIGSKAMDEVEEFEQYISGGC